MRASLHRRITAPLALAAISGLALTGFTSTSIGQASRTSSGATQTVTVYTADPGTEGQEFQASWSAWAKKHNIKIDYTGDGNFTADIVTKIQGNDLPDIAFFPQPGLLSAAVATGKVVPVNAATKKSVKKNFSSDWQSYVKVKGTMYATPLDASVKGYVWYSPAQFKKWGITVPKTYAQLLADTKTIQQKTGKPPWCAGFNSGTSSGWPGADQLAEMVLSSAGPTVYDSWVAGKTKFTSPAINKAFTLLGEILQNPKYVNAGYGNIASINSTAFGDVATPLANGTCAMTNQATFLEANIETAKTAAGATPTVGPNGDIWAFPLPAIKAGQTAVVGGGDFAAAFNKSKATQEVMQYLSSSAWANSLISVKGASFISANKGVKASKEKDPLLKSAIQTLQSPKTVFRFGADDAMPNVVENAFWTGMVNWIDGKSQKVVEQQIQAAWASANG